MTEISPVSTFGRALMAMGAILFVLGLVLYLAPRVPFLGRLPGDISIQRGNWSFYFPVVTCLVVSLLLTLILWLWSALRR